MRCNFLYCVEASFNLPFLFPQKLESQMRDVAYGTKQYKAAPLEVIQYTEINKCIKTKILLLKKGKMNHLAVLHLFKAGFLSGQSRSCIQKHRAMRSSETGGEG